MPLANLELTSLVRGDTLSADSVSRGDVISEELVNLRSREIYTVKWRYNAVEYNNISHISLQMEAEHESEIESIKDTPYLTLTGELWYAF